VTTLLKRTIQIVEGEVQPETYFADNQSEKAQPPPLSSSFEHPEKSQAIIAFKSRFSI
jgi:hypothetical protein